MLNVTKQNSKWAEKQLTKVLPTNVLQRSTSCSILPSRMGEHGVSWENMENMENMDGEHGRGTDGKHQPGDLKHSIYDSKQSINNNKMT